MVTNASFQIRKKQEGGHQQGHAGIGGKDRFNRKGFRIERRGREKRAKQGGGNEGIGTLNKPQGHACWNLTTLNLGSSLIGADCSNKNCIGLPPLGAGKVAGLKGVGNEGRGVCIELGLGCK